LPVNEDEESPPLEEDGEEEMKVNGNATSEGSNIANDDADNTETEIAKSNGDE